VALLTKRDPVRQFLNERRAPHRHSRDNIDFSIYGRRPGESVVAAPGWPYLDDWKALHGFDACFVASFKKAPADARLIAVKVILPTILKDLTCCFLEPER
jgi:hypothetical protein